ncbi:Mn-dependent transcriptional regulator MntR [Actinomycetales bacterium JB111]|nr:Mn-dependent transcriptional regulator MntR [Actinomycetales bacterium JB111]
MSVSQLSASTQNYLKAIWGLTEWSSEPVTPTLIAQRTGLRLSSVSDAVRKMSTQGLVEHAPYGAVELTDQGRTFALAMVRRHRLIESFLVRVLHYTWDQVHDEAEVLEHAVSDFMIERIDQLLDFPSRDPHGDPIPSADGTVTVPDARPLTEIGADTRVVVERISDSDPSLLQFFDGHDIVVGTHLEVDEGAPYSGALDVRVDGARPSVALGRPASDALYVSVAP